MKRTIEPSTEPAAKAGTMSRRGAAALAVTAAAGTALIASGESASAATGQSVVQGAVNNAGGGATVLNSASAKPTLSVKNTGSGAGALFQAVNSNGFAGGTFHPDRYGLSAANSGAAGGGSALAASGVNNTGVLANTNNPDRFAVDATNASAVGANGGAVVADGGQNLGLLALGQPAAAFGGDLLLNDTAVVNLTPGGNAIFGTWSDRVIDVTISGVTTLGVSGAVVIPATSQAGSYAELDYTTARVFVTPNTRAMPNLWASVDPSTGDLSISGGAAGDVSYSVMAEQAAPANRGKQAAASKKAATTARAKKAGKAVAAARTRSQAK